jgi:hypothetical protein
LQTLLNGYVENDPASAGKRFMRVVTLLEDHPMHDLVNAVVAAAQRGTDERPRSRCCFDKRRARIKWLSRCA